MTVVKGSGGLEGKDGQDAINSMDFILLVGIDDVRYCSTVYCNTGIQ